MTKVIGYCTQTSPTEVVERLIREDNNLTFSKQPPLPLSSTEVKKVLWSETAISAFRSQLRQLVA